MTLFVLGGGFGLSDNVKYAMWGYSGGSLSSEVAAEVQSVYAPELRFSGAALGGLVSNITAVYDAIDSTPYAGLIVTSLLGIGNEYPTVKQHILRELRASGPYNRTGFLAARDMSAEDAYSAYGGQSVWRYFKSGRSVMNASVVMDAFNDNGFMGYHGTPQLPIHIYQAIHDEVTPITSTDKLVARYCRVGVNILYERNTVGGHIEEMANGNARAFKWLSDVLGGNYEGQYASLGCTITNVTVNATADAA